VQETGVCVFVTYLTKFKKKCFLTNAVLFVSWLALKPQICIWISYNNIKAPKTYVEMKNSYLENVWTPTENNPIALVLFSYGGSEVLTRYSFSQIGLQQGTIRGSKEKLSLLTING
jgi:hypothetical protein